MFSNPFREKAADPYILAHEGWYYLMATTGHNLTLVRSRTFGGFKTAEEKVIYTPQAGAANAVALWAPELYHIDGKWYVYYAATSGAPEKRRMFVLEGDGGDPFECSWRDCGMLRFEPDRWAIDGSLLIIGGEMYMVWSGWEGHTDISQNLYISKMKTPLVSEGERVLISEPQHEWECHPVPGQDFPTVNEGPCALYGTTGLTLVYSASHFLSGRYCLGVLSLKPGADPMLRESWTKHPQPVFHAFGSSTIYGPGHNSFLQSQDRSVNWMIYHAFLSAPPHKGTFRAGFAIPFSIDDFGFPTFDAPAEPGSQQEEPSFT